jgi:uncharacterized membrane protein YiaA
MHELEIISMGIIVLYNAEKSLTENGVYYGVLIKKFYQKLA